MNSKKRKAGTVGNNKRKQKKPEKSVAAVKEDTNQSDSGSEHSSNLDDQQKPDNGRAPEESSPNDNKDSLKENDSEVIESDTNDQENKKIKVDLSKDAGTLLFSGGTNWDLIGRKELPKAARKQASAAEGPNLWGPHRLSSLNGIRVTYAVSSCTACHSIICTDDGRIMSWGRNDKSQLGLGDTVRRNSPCLIEGLSAHIVVTAACGRGHSLFLTDGGEVYACGDNKMGQLGIGSQNNTMTTPKKVSYSGHPITKIACGAEFSVILNGKGSLYTFGLPEYGQLGHNTDGQYFVSANKLSFSAEVQPRRLLTFIEKTREGHVVLIDDVRITDIACGANHTIALDDNGHCFSWGFGGYGRLGHNEQKDEFVPRLIKSFDGPNRGVKSIYAGGSFSLAINPYGLLFFWGMNKKSGEATMYPKPIQDLSGWFTHYASCGNTAIVVKADESVITWGPSPANGELCYGENQPKSSTVPKEAKPLEGLKLKAISCGYAHTLVVVDDTTDEAQAKLKKFPEFKEG